MENASKALLISASILIAIILIAFAVRTISSTQGTQEAVESTMTAAEIAMFNNKFTSYLGNNKSPAEARALVNTVLAHNATVNNVETEGVYVMIISNDSGISCFYKCGLTGGNTDRVGLITRVSKITNNVKISAAEIRTEGTIKKINIDAR